MSTPHQRDAARARGVRPPHVHGEAFAVMCYRADDGEQEFLWNSRDGVTPFVITLRSGKEATHVEWQNDVYCPDHMAHMSVGDRYFADLDPESALIMATQRVEEWWDHPEYPMSARWTDKEHAAQDLAKGYMDPPGSPTIREVLA